MSDQTIKRALISVYDKTGVVDFARSLHEDFGIEILSTGGTAKLLKENDIPVTLVEEVTGCAEMMNGRVKTLHPNVHAGILANRDNPDHMRQLARAGIKSIDMVVVNLYPFEEIIAKEGCTFEQAIEMIDIGGPCMLRAAAKNHKHVLVVELPHMYGDAIEALRNWNDPQIRREALTTGGVGGFLATARYDTKIAQWLSSMQNEGRSLPRFIEMWSWGPLRYGENPHQEAEVLDRYSDGYSGENLTTADTVPGAEEPGVELSFNNYVDADAAFGLCADLSQGLSINGSQKAVVFVKHTNACGVGISGDPIEAYRRAYLGDPNAAMGGILACNFKVTADFAEAVMGTLDRWGRDAGAGAFFIEVWIANKFEESAVEIIRTRKQWGQRVRLLHCDADSPAKSAPALVRSITGGMLMQSPDTLGLDESNWEVVTERQPTEHEWADLRLAWLTCKHTKSNAISICKDGMLIGNGAGQMSRVMSCRIATWLAKENGHENSLYGSVAASDAFFPFRDGPDILADAGVTAIIQPGGSKRDADTIAACAERGIAMVFTGTRHFKH